MSIRTGKRLFTAVLCSLLVKAPTAAQSVRNDTIADRIHRLQGVTVTESHRQKELQSTAPYHLLEQQQYNRLGIADIADALHRIPGITLRDYGGAGGMKTVSVRGFGAKHTGVCYDGMMLSDCQSGEIDVSRYGLEHTSHLSLVVGDNDDIFIPARQAASAAVLSIQTIRPATTDPRPHLTAQLKAGSFGYVSPFLSYEQCLSPHFTFSAVGKYIHADNRYPFTLQNLSLVTEEKRSNSGMDQGNGELNFAWTLNSHNQLNGKAYYYDNDRELPGQVHYYTTQSNEQLRERNFFGQLQYRTFWKDNLSLRWDAKFNWASASYKNGPVGGGIAHTDYWQREAYTTASLLFTPRRQWAFSYAADYAFNNLNSNLLTDTRPYRHTVLQSAAARYKDARLTALARVLWSLYLNDALDGPSAKNMRRLSPSLSLSYRLLSDESLFLRASYKNIFRVPTFNESYYFHYGSTSLEPEISDQFNVGLTWESHRKPSATHIRMTADIYYNKVKDMIVAVPYNMFIWTNVNVGRVRVLGTDATLHISHPINSRHTLLLSANYTLQRAENCTNRESPNFGKLIAYMPQHAGSASVAWENPWVNLSFHGVGCSKRYSNNNHYEDTEVKGYTDFGVTVYRSFRAGTGLLEVRGDLKNLFDQQYEIVRMYPMPGRNVQISINYKL